MSKIFFNKWLYVQRYYDGWNEDKIKKNELRKTKRDLHEVY